MTRFGPKDEFDREVLSEEEYLREKRMSLAGSILSVVHELYSDCLSSWNYSEE